MLLEIKNNNRIIAIEVIPNFKSEFNLYIPN